MEPKQKNCILVNTRIGYFDFIRYGTHSYSQETLDLERVVGAVVSVDGEDNSWDWRVRESQLSGLYRIGLVQSY